MTKAIIIDSTLAQYTAEDFSWLQKFFLQPGIFATSAGVLGLAVSQRGAGANLSVDVAVGNALLDFTKNATNWKIIGLVNAVANVVVPTQSSGSNRVGAVIMRASVSLEPNALKTNIITLEYIPGTGVGALTDGAITTAVGADAWIRLANVTVPTGASSIVTGNIADARVQVQTNEAMTLAPKNLKFTVQATDPTTPVEGQFWYNSTTHTLNFYNNSTVVTLGGSSAYLSDDNTTSDGYDQTQTTNNANVPVGEADATTKKNKIAQSVQFAKTTVAGVKLAKVADTGAFTGTVTVSLQADSAGSPSGTPLATVTISNANYLAIPVGNFLAVFGTPYTVLPATTYWLVIETSTSDNSNHPNLGTASAGGYASGSVKLKNTTDGWTAIATIDLYFKTLTGITTKVLRADANNFVPAFAPYGADAGGTDAYYIELAGILSYVAGHVYSFKANTANTGACTLNINGLGAKTIKKNVSVDLDDNDILASQMVDVIYDGTNFQLLSAPSSANIPNSFVGASVDTGFLISTQNVDTVFTPGFKAKLITLYYSLAGADSNTMLYLSGIASFNGTTLVANYIFQNKTGGGTTAYNYNNTVLNASTITVGGVSGNSNTVTLSILSITATQFTVRISTLTTSSMNGGGKFYPVAFR